MSIADKLTIIAENVPKVYEAGQKSEYDRFWDEFQVNGTRTAYRYAFAGYAWTKEMLKPKYPIRFKDVTAATRSCMGMFYMFAGGNTGTNETVDWKELNLDIDFSNCLNLNYTFSNSKLDNIDVDCSSATNIQNMAMMSDSNQLLTTFKMKITDACTNASNAFGYCGNLTNLSFHEGSCLACSLDLQRSTKLTHESIMNVINILKDYSGSGTTYTLTLGSTNLAKLTDAEKAIATSRGWTLD